jgi:hypothetical protein
MADPTLTDRYVAAVERSVPETGRGDIADELRASIQDQVDARVDAGEPERDAERAVLTELGDPAALAAGYAGRPLALIGPAHYLTWLRLLKLLLAVGLPVAVVINVLARILGGTQPGELIGVTIGTVLTVGVHIFFWTTLAFWIIDRVGTTDPMPGWSVDRLPKPRPRGAGLMDAVASGVAILLAIGAIAWDRVWGFLPTGGGWTSVLDDSPVVLAVLIGLFALQLVLPIVAWVRARWDLALGIASAVLGVVTAVVIIALLLSGTLLSAELTTRIAESGAATVVSTIATVAIVALTIWAAVDALRRARR